MSTTNKHFTMKKILFIALLTAGTASFAIAQSTSTTSTTTSTQQTAPKPVKTPEERATDVANRMTKDLGLTADQTAKIHDLALTRAQKMDALKSTPSADKTAENTARKKIENDFDAGAKTVLTADQYTKWQAEKAEHKEEHKQNKTAPA